MADYKITKDSVTFENGHTRFMVSFNGGPEELYEVQGNDAETIYDALDKAATAIDVQQPGGAAPALVTNKKLNVGVEKEKAKLAKLNQ